MEKEASEKLYEMYYMRVYSKIHGLTKGGICTILIGVFGFLQIQLSAPGLDSSSRCQRLIRLSGSPVRLTAM